MRIQDITQTLVESFNALSDEVQYLSDRQIVLEHKLRYAHEQFQYLADKYAPAAPQVSETLAKLQLPTDPASAETSSVPILRQKSLDSRHEIALIIQEGRRAASSLTDWTQNALSNGDSVLPTTMTSLSTILEQDFTVEGKKGILNCPFAPPSPDHTDVHSGGQALDADTTPHHSSDPICAAMSGDTSQPAPGASKCPIRFLDRHSAEEVAHYVETHKHELPRSHEVCFRRFQKNEDEMQKLDAKYGNLVQMVEGLSKIHKPMLPEQDTRPQSDVEKGSNERVETWAQTVSACSAGDDPDITAMETPFEDGEDRSGHFDRPLKEVRVGESPSRPWGISVPAALDPPYSPNGGELERPETPPAAPVQMPPSSASAAQHTETLSPGKSPAKCPFDHTKFQLHGATATPLRPDDKDSAVHSNQPFTPATPAVHLEPPPTTTPGRPMFLNAPETTTSKPDHTPQMLLTGPVFIDYPIEQAIQFMQHFQGHP